MDASEAAARSTGAAPAASRPKSVALQNLQRPGDRVARRDEVFTALSNLVAAGDDRETLIAGLADLFSADPGLLHAVMIHPGSHAVQRQLHATYAIRTRAL